jgi:hypothetical protein
MPPNPLALLEAPQLAVRALEDFHRPSTENLMMAMPGSKTIARRAASRRRDLRDDEA